ncbi:MAG: cytochrome C assembly family protein [Alphaproteobacteria bacterium]
MKQELLFGLSAFAALLPSIFIATRDNNTRDSVFWLTLAVAVAGPASWVAVQLSGSWQTGLSTALWVTIAATMIGFSVVVLLNDSAWRLTPLVTPYMAVLAVFALIWQQVPAVRPLTAAAPDGWIEAHILVSVTTYALITLAAVAALAAFLQERALKSKRPTPFSRSLPSVLESEGLMVRLLVIGEIVLALGLLTGMATQQQETGTLLHWDHKTVLSLGTFGVVAVLLIAHFKSGVRGRLVTRFVLLAYLLLSLGYPGVKFVTDILMG